jgi:hypothetical protein
MKRLFLSLIGLLCIGAVTGCCCTGGYCGSPCGSPCGPGGCGYSPYAPYGGGTVVAPTSAYYPATTVQAAVPILPTYAAAPVQVLPTY